MANLPVPVMPTEVPGNFMTSALQNTIGLNGVGFCIAQPVYLGYQATTQGIPNTTWTAFGIDTTLLDSYGGHSNVTNNSRYTPQVAGTYLVIGSSGYGINGTGFRRTRIHLNGSAIQGTGHHHPTSDSANVIGAVVSTMVTCNGSTDYIEVAGQQASGGAISSNPGADFSPSMRVFWLHN